MGWSGKGCIYKMKVARPNLQHRASKSGHSAPAQLLPYDFHGLTFPDTQFKNKTPNHTYYMYTNSLLRKKNISYSKLYLLFVWDRVSCSPGWPQTHCETEDSLDSSASQSAGLQAQVIVPGLQVLYLTPAAHIGNNDGSFIVVIF